jgi:hypothetical protein
MEHHGLVHLVDHRQADAPGLWLVEQFAVLLPAVQGRQRIELALDRPVGADHGVGAADQPDAHHVLQQSARCWRSGMFRRCSMRACEGLSSPASSSSELSIIPHAV